MKPTIKGLIGTACVAVGAFLAMQFYQPFWEWEHTDRLRSVQDLNQTFGLTFPPQSQVIEGECFREMGHYEANAVIRLRPQDVAPFLAQSGLKACPPHQMVSVRAFLAKVPEDFDNPVPFWSPKQARRFNIALADNYQLLVDLDDPHTATVYIAED